MSSQESSLFRLQVTADADPSALARVLERFQNLNILPRRVVAEVETAVTLRIQIDIKGLPEDTMSLIAAKLRQVPCILHAHWHRQ